jgi:hypothetical protein
MLRMPLPVMLRMPLPVMLRMPLPVMLRMPLPVMELVLEELRSAKTNWAPPNTKIKATIAVASFFCFATCWRFSEAQFLLFILILNRVFL